MSDIWHLATGTISWAGQSAGCGALVLLVGWIGLRFIRAPAHQQRLAAWTLRSAVLVPLLCLLPAWLTISLPTGWRSSSPEIAVLTAAKIPDGVEAQDNPVRAIRKAPLPPAEFDGSEVVLRKPSRFDEVTPNHAPVVADANTNAVPEIVPPIPAPEQKSPEQAKVTFRDTLTVTDENSLPEYDSLSVETPSWRDLVVLVMTSHFMLVLYFFGELLVGHVALAKLRRNAVPASARVRAVFDEMTTKLRRKPTVLVSDKLLSPLCFGVLRPTILLPKALAGVATVDELKWIFAHELDHLGRGDALTGWFAGVARSLFYFVPWFWAVRRELVLSQEFLADAAAVAAGGKSVDYAEFLVNLSQGTTSPTRRGALPAQGVWAGRSDLFRRVTMLLKNENRGTHTSSRRWNLLAAATVLSAAVTLSGLSIVQADDDKAKNSEQPKPRETRVEVEVRNETRADDEKPKERSADQAPREEKKPTERTPETRQFNFRALEVPNLGEIKKLIAEAAKKGDIDEVNKLVDRLEKALSNMRGPGDRGGFNPLAFPVPPVPPVAPAPARGDRPQARVEGPNLDQIRGMTEQHLKGLHEALSQLKDNPVAREALERAVQQAHKAMAEADQVLKNKPAMQDALQRGQVDVLRAKIEAEQQLAKLQAEHMTKLADQFRMERSDDLRRTVSPRLGVMPANVPEALAEQLDLAKGSGILVSNVVGGSVAEKAGVKKNDIILLFAGKEVGGDPAKFTELVGQVKPGEKVEVVVLRKGKKETIKGLELPQPPQIKRVLNLNENRDAPRVKFESVQVQVNNSDFKINAKKGDVTYNIAGKIEDGKLSKVQITILDGKDTMLLTGTEKFPEQHRDAIRTLLSMVSDRPGVATSSVNGRE